MFDDTKNYLTLTMSNLFYFKSAFNNTTVVLRNKNRNFWSFKILKSNFHEFIFSQYQPI